MASGFLCGFVGANINENITRNIAGVGSGDKGGTERGHSGDQSSNLGCGQRYRGHKNNHKKELPAWIYTTKDWG